MYQKAEFVLNALLRWQPVKVSIHCSRDMIVWLDAQDSANCGIRCSVEWAYRVEFCTGTDATNGSSGREIGVENINTFNKVGTILDNHPLPWPEMTPSLD
jgi:hypothetical protein